MAVERFSSPPPSLSGRLIGSERQAGVSYRLERQIGEGSSGMAYLALREAQEGVSPVVLKFVRIAEPSSRVSAEILVQKEAVALGRLNERVPPTPFVVRLLDTGTTTLFDEDAMPWLALEYVHGGVEGTTLEDRVLYGIHRTGYAFDPTRALHMLRCLSAGLGAIHGVGVIHRDITPGNVLCCGFGESEIFKISDFGVARPHGLSSTFGGMGVGTAGYAAPEQSVPDKSLGPCTDMFGFACLVYYALTGDHYFEATSPVQAYTMVREKHRRSITESRWLCPELREQPDSCRAIDALLARATAFSAEQRPQSAQELRAALAPWFGNASSAPRPSRRLVDSLIHVAEPGEISRWTWTVRHPPRHDIVIQSAAWDTDGRCFALTARGPLFWDGLSWLPVPDVERALPPGMSFTRRYEPGGWLLGGAGGTLALHDADGVREIVRAPDTNVHFSHASGRFDDLLAAVGQRAGEPPMLWAMAARRWMKPLRLEGVTYVASLLRLDESRWVVCGRSTQGSGFAAIFSPMQWEVAFLPTPRTRAFVAGASEPERKAALVVGADGVALHLQDDRATGSLAPGAPDLTAAAIDVLAREWVASVGRLWVRDPERDSDWRSVWSSDAWQSPFITLMADAGMLVAMTVDGGILEGRAGWNAPRHRRSR